LWIKPLADAPSLAIILPECRSVNREKQEIGADPGEVLMMADGPASVPDKTADSPTRPANAWYTSLVGVYASPEGGSG